MMAAHERLRQKKTTPGEIAALPATILLAVSPRAHLMRPLSHRKPAVSVNGLSASRASPTLARELVELALRAAAIELLLLLLLLLRIALLHRRRGPNQRMRLLRSRPD